MVKQIYFFILFTFMAATTSFGQIQKINMDSVSYGFGVLIAKSLQKQGVDSLDITSFSKAIEDVISGSEPTMTVEEANAMVQKYMAAQQAKKYEGIINEGKEFLEANGARAEVTTTASGLQYEVLTPGTGAQPTASDRVTVHYTGKLISGKVFDSSVERGQPATFGVTQVIGGWTEALQLMKEGAKYRLYIPYDLAYGERGAGQDIPPYATLIFDVELLSIQ